MTAVALPQKIALLIPRLGSSFDPEIVATAKAIERALKAAGRDWHDLARAVDAPAPAPMEEPGNFLALVRWCRSRSWALNEREREFVNDMATRLVCGGIPTERQAAWLRAIYARLREASA